VFYGPPSEWACPQPCSSVAKAIGRPGVGTSSMDPEHPGFAQGPSTGPPRLAWRLPASPGSFSSFGRGQPHVPVHGAQFSTGPVSPARTTATKPAADCPGGRPRAKSPPPPDRDPSAHRCHLTGGFGVPPPGDLPAPWMCLNGPGVREAPPMRAGAQKKGMSLSSSRAATRRQDCGLHLGPSGLPPAGYPSWCPSQVTITYTAISD